MVLFEVSDQALIKEFKKLDGSTNLKNVPVHVSQTRNLNTLDQYDLIYVGTNDEATITKIQTLIEGKAILMITHNVANQRLVMINLLQTETQQLHFEINMANVINNRLVPFPELILLGGTEIDIATLYREGQDSLIGLQNQLNTQQSQFEIQQSQFNTQQRQFNILKKQASFQQDINK